MNDLGVCTTGFSQWGFILARAKKPYTLKSPCKKSRSARFCCASLQAGIVDSSRCPPEGERYMDQNRVRTQTPNSVPEASGGIAVDSGMAHVAASDHVDHVFGDIGGVVGDALQIFGYQD